MFKLDLEKAEEPEIRLPISVGSSKKRKRISLATLKPLTVWITTNCGKFFKRWEYQTTLLASWETCMQVKKQQLELDMEQQTDSKSGKEHIKAVYCHSAYLTSMQSTSLEVPGWMKHKLESGMPGEISITSDMKMTSLTWWTWVWENSGRWWWTGRPGVLRFMGSQTVDHDWVTELNW